MKQLLQKLKDFKELYIVMAFFIGLVVSLFIGVHTLLNKNDEILKTIQTTQQMALKSVIWNDSIPLVERASACDTYLNAGYNSLTKKHCQDILNI